MWSNYCSDTQRSKARYLGIEVDDALAIAEQVDCLNLVGGGGAPPVSFVLLIFRSLWDLACFHSSSSSGVIADMLGGIVPKAAVSRCSKLCM